MTDRAALLAAVLADPADDTPRLVFADWLDETGDPADAARAAFIRAEVAAARYPLHSPTPASLYRQARRQFEAFGDAWNAELPEWLVAEAIGRYRRGFVEDVELSIQAFVARAAELFAAVPVTTLRLTLPYAADPPVPFSVFGMRPELARVATLQLGESTLTTGGGGWLHEPTLFDDLMSCPTLTGVRRLILSGNLLTVEAVREFCRRLPSAAFAGSLAELDLADCQLAASALHWLASARGLDRIRRVNLSGNRIDPGALVLLRERFDDGLIV